MDSFLDAIMCGEAFMEDAGLLHAHTFQESVEDSYLGHSKMSLWWQGYSIVHCLWLEEVRRWQRWKWWKWKWTLGWMTSQEGLGMEALCTQAS